MKNLYYELAVAHPVFGKMGILLTAMLAEDQPLTSVHWLRSFRYAEKQMFGYSQPIKYAKMIISGKSMIFILAALKEFNNEELPDYH